VWKELASHTKLEDAIKRCQDTYFLGVGACNGITRSEAFQGPGDERLEMVLLDLTAGEKPGGKVRGLGFGVRGRGRIRSRIGMRSRTGIGIESRILLMVRVRVNVKVLERRMAAASWVAA